MSEFNENNQEFAPENSAPENSAAENTAEPAAAAEPQFFTDGAEVVSGVEVAQKKSAGKIIAIIALVIVLLFGCCIASYAFIPQVKNTVKMMMNSPEEYYAWVETENTDDFEWLTEAFEQAEKTDSVVNASINLDSAAIEGLMAENGASLDEAEFKIPSSIGMEVKSAEIDGVQSANEIITVDGNTLMTCNAYVKDGKIFYQIPELSSSYISMDFAKLMELATAEAESNEVTEILTGLFTSMMDNTDESEKLVTNEELREFLVKYSELLFTSAEKVELVKDTACEADGVKCEYNKLVVSIDEGSLYTFAKKALKELKDEAVVIKVVEKLGLTKEDYQTAIDELSTQLGDYEISGGETLCIMNVYVNSKGEVVGREFVNAEGEDGAFKLGYTLTNDGDKYGFAAIADIDAEVFEVNGNATEKSGKLTGEAKIAYNNSDVFGLTFKDFECDDEFVKGSVTLGLSALELDDMTLNFDVKDDKQTLDTAFTYQGTKLFDITMEMSDEAPDSITVFNNEAKVYDMVESMENGAALEEYMAEADMETFARNLVTAFGLDEALVDEFVAGFEEGFSGSLMGNMGADEEFIEDIEVDEDFSDEDYVDNSVYYDFSKVKVQLDGKEIKLPGKVDGVLDGVEFETDKVEAYDYAYGYNEDYSVSVSVENATDKEVSPAECDIISLAVNEEAGIDFAVDGFTFGDDITKVAQHYGTTVDDMEFGFIDINAEEDFGYITFYYMDGAIYEISVNY